MQGETSIKSAFTPIKQRGNHLHRWAEYGFAVLLVIFIIGTGITMVAREVSTAKQSESFKWEHTSGDEVYAENVVVQFLKYENDREMGYNLSTDEISRVPLTDMSRDKDGSVEKFYKNNEEVFKPYSSFFRGQSKFEKVGEHYYWDGTTLAYATVKGNQANGDSSDAYLQLKVLNTKSGKIMEAETTLGDAASFGPLDVFDVQVINNKLYVTTLNTFERDMYGTDMSHMFRFDMKTLEGEGYRRMVVKRFGSYNL